eukprot:CAMPEP_0119172568 /NCGR_PEP_ID=MMETSP1315-20130426/29501_1 /TAXON_ID=676789 /ORGANISM="Prasinoderma singularis, Strain RCC927" /LENGTH=116 /DNA_ID=CAMNT_0007166467 /DNA_START=116 /DNA_END=463 /DNA_ORIENTATION=+
MTQRRKVAETVAIYREVVDATVAGIKADFEQEGTHASTLSVLQKRWEAKLVASGALGPLVKREADEGGSNGGGAAKATAAADGAPPASARMQAFQSAAAAGGGASGGAAAGGAAAG